MRSTPMSVSWPYTENKRERRSPSMSARWPSPAVVMVTFAPSGMVSAKPLRAYVMGRRISVEVVPELMAARSALMLPTSSPDIVGGADGRRAGGGEGGAKGGGEGGDGEGGGMGGGH